MKMKIQILNKSIIVFLLCSLISYGQMNDYRFKRKIDTPKDNWHKIILPDDIFINVSSSLSDLRIYGIVNDTDTIEVPYILKEIKEFTTLKEVPFKLINNSNKYDDYFYTFETTTDGIINQIKLNFSQNNFDWIVKLEGSQNLIDWFTIKENNRILSIVNSNVNYRYSELTFQDSKYHFYRINFFSYFKPKLLSAILFLEVKEPVNSREYSNIRTKSRVDKRLKQTIVDIELESILPVSSLKIITKDEYDYYRPLKIQIVTDSIKTKNGWSRIYKDVYSGILSSFENPYFNFNTAFSKMIRVEIENNDNEPLQVDRVEVKGNDFELTARFDKGAEYYLVYGNKKTVFPDYDIDNFKDKIPSVLSSLSLGIEEPIPQNQVNDDHPLFENKLYLWLIMVVAILIIGWFSFNMIRNKK